MLTDEPRHQPRSATDALYAATPRRFIDLLVHGACSIDRARNVLEINVKAAGLLTAGAPLQIRAGRLHAQSAALISELNAYLEAPERWDRACTIKVPRKAPLRPMIVRIERQMALCTTCADGSPRFLVHIFLPTHDWSIPEELLRHLYGLTGGEARVVHLLLRGSRVSTIARDLDVAPETVRTHLKHAMRKLEVSTQLQLVQVVASGPWR
jgi:DNA-binding CsgD family transcriptional regulator